MDTTRGDFRMAQTFLLRPHRRRFAAALAALLVVPLLVVTAPPAAADDPIYDLQWRHADGSEWNDGPHSIVALTSGDSAATLVRSISNVNETLTDVSDDVAVTGDSATLVCDPFPDEITGDAEATCTMDADFAEDDTVLEFTGTLSYDTETAPPATATALHMVRGEFTPTGDLPIEVGVGEDVTVTFDVINPGSAPLNIDRVRLPHHSGSYLQGVCSGNEETLESGETASVTCGLGPTQQDTQSHLTAQSISLSEHPPSRGILSTMSDVVEVLLDDPSVEIVATADPDTLMNGGVADVDVTVENTSDIIFDELRMSVATDAGEVCTDTAADPFDGDVTWEPNSACEVEPAAGEATTVTIELDYLTGDGTQTHTPDPVVVDLTSDSTDLAVEARAGVMNETLTPPGFVARDVLPLHPDPNYHLGGPAALEVTVTNPGTIDLVDVEVTVDVPGCDRTLNIAGGDAETYTCDGPELSPGDATATTTVTATADAEGTALEATDTADFSAFGIAADVTVDPDWDGVDLALPFLITIENVGAHELEWNAAAWQVVDQFGNWWDAPADTCSVASGDEFAPPAEQSPLPVGGTVTHDGCTLLAGDLVDGLTIRAVGVRDAWGEGPGSYDLVELQFDPDGAVHGTAELDGDAFADVTVELRLLELLELPRTEPEDFASAAGAGDTVALSGDDCTSVGELAATDEGDIVATTTSDADGDFCFDDVPPGSYEIVVDTDVGADLDEVVVDGAAGFTTNSPATSEPFFVGFASATLGEAVQASLTFSAVVPVDDDDEESDDPGAVEPIDADTDDPEEELAATGGGVTTITLVALLALLLGAATLAISRRIAVRVTREVQPG
jgi:hypothetical protein